MLYRKNLPVWERTARVVAGILMGLCGFLGPGLAGTPVGLIIVAAGGAHAADRLLRFLPGLRDGRTQAESGDGAGWLMP